MTRYHQSSKVRSKRVLICTWADLFNRRNLKTDDFLPIESAVKRARINTQVLYRRGQSHSLDAKAMVSPIAFHLYGAYKKFNPVRARQFIEHYIDKKMARAITGSELCVIFHGLRFPITSRRCRTLNIKTIGIATSCHPLYELKRLAAERSKFDNAPPSYQNVDVRTIDNLDYLITFSDFSAETYRNHSAIDRIRVADLTDLLKPMPHPVKKKSYQGNFLVSAGTGSLNKGLMYVLGIAHLLPSGTRLHIVGNYLGFSHAQDQKLREVTSTLNNVHFHEFMQPQQYQEFLETVDVYIQPSLSEGYGKVVLECIGRGIPVICSREGQACVRDGFNGIVVPSANQDAILTAVTKLHQETSLRDELIRNCYRTRPSGRLETEIFAVLRDCGLE